jgi:hypothetical protein
MTRKFVSAEEAVRWGFITKVVPHDKLMEEAFALAEEIKKMPPLSLRAVKKAVNQGMQGYDFAEYIMDSRRRRGRNGGHERLPRKEGARVQRQVDASTPTLRIGPKGKRAISTEETKSPGQSTRAFCFVDSVSNLLTTRPSLRCPFRRDRRLVRSLRASPR